ncbi:hypothetical protein OAV26_01480, partial [Crocinitomicaceae bacterium]|nr:hypothetical protein [Crocinitomicaceae bacterium]
KILRIENHIFVTSNYLNMNRLLLLLTICISSFSFGQYTSIPDPNFEQALIDLGHDDVLDGQVLSGNISVVTNLDVSGDLVPGGLIINDLTGIEDFINLRELDCYQNNLSILDLSQNDSLTRVHCQNNQLTQLNVVNPFIIRCTDNQLVELDLSQANRLTHLYCDNNFLSGLDLSNASFLKVLFCENNQLSNLVLNCASSLDYLLCANNNLTTLDLLNYQTLNILACQGNQLTDLNVSTCFDLEGLECAGNLLTTLDVSNCFNLLALECYSNQLNCLDLRNSQNTNLVVVRAIDNPDLTCIQVDNVDFSNIFWLTSTNNDFMFDSQQYFSEDCGNDCSGTSNLTELNSNQPKALIKIVNLLGQEVEYTPNTVLIYQYSDGTSEKVFTIED